MLSLDFFCILVYYQSAAIAVHTPESSPAAYKGAPLDISRISAELLALTLAHARRIGGPMPRAWLPDFGPEGYICTLDDITAPEWTPGMIAFANELRETARRILTTLDEVGHTPENLMAAFILSRAALDEANLLNLEGFDRPGINLAGFFHWEGEVKKMMRYSREHNVGTPLEVLRGRMACVQTELENTYEVCFGRASVGWLSRSEKDRVLSLINGMSDNGAHDRIHTLWIDNGGTEPEWLTVWPAFVEAIRIVLPLFENKEAPSEPVLMGHSGLRNYLKSAWINNDPEECLARFRKLESVYRREMKRLKKLESITQQAAPPCPTSARHLKRLVLGHRRRFYRDFVKSGILPSAWDPRPVDITVRPWRNKTPTLADANQNGTAVTILPFKGHQKDWEASYAAQLGMTVAHELMHCGQSKQRVIPKTWRGHLGQEGGAILMQWAWAMKDRHPKVLQAMVYADYRFVRSMRVCFEWHLGTQTDTEEIIAEYCADTGLTRDSAMRMLENIQLGASFYGTYWLGMVFNEMYVRERHNDDPVEALRELAQKTGMIVPPHVLLGEVSPSTFRLKWPRQPLAVRLSRQIYPL